MIARLTFVASVCLALLLGLAFPTAQQLPGNFPPGVFSNTAALAPSAITTTSWNLADTDAQTTVTGSGLILTTASGLFALSDSRSIASHATGKYYSTHLINEDNGFAAFMGIGFSNSSFPLTSDFTGSGVKSFGYHGDGTVNSCGAGSPISTIQTYAKGNTVGQAIDFDNGKAWWQVNGGNWNNDIIANQNPSTNTGGISFSTIGACTGSAVYFATMIQLVFTATAQQSTANYGPTPLTNFVNW